MEEKPWLKHYDPGVVLTPAYTNVPLNKQFISHVQKHPDRPYIFSEDRTITYREADMEARKLANALINSGVQKGDRVAVTLPNIPEFVVAVQACLKIGAIIVPTNPRYKKRELTHQYLDSGTQTVLCWNQAVDVHTEMLHENEGFLKTIIGVPGDSYPAVQSKAIINYKEFINASPAHEPESNTSLGDTALLVYTGGTTGVSKGCRITHKNLIAVASAWKQMCQYFTDVDNYKVLSSTPMYHIHGFQTTINANILLGGSMILLPEITTGDILNAINKYEPNVWPAVPAQIKSITKHRGLPASKAHRIQHIGCGASPIPVAAMEAFERIVGVPIIEGYGASETSMAVASNPYRKRKVGSVGIPYPNIDFKVVDIKTGNVELPLGEVGELCFKGPQVISEYWNHPEETALAIREGWWYSGDIGYMDDDGFIFLLDRKKDMIICNGFNVYSNEVDEILNSHPKILEAGVIGAEDADRGEIVKAYVVVKPGEVLAESEIKDYCRQYLAAYKIPALVEFSDKLPRTPVHKLDRKALRQKSGTL